MRCSFSTLLICCSAPFVCRFFIFSFCLSLYCFLGLRICCSFGILFIYFFIVIILCCIFVFLFTYMPLTFVEVHVCSTPDLLFSPLKFCFRTLFVVATFYYYENIQELFKCVCFNSLSAQMSYI